MDQATSHTYLYIRYEIFLLRIPILKYLFNAILFNANPKAFLNCLTVLLHRFPTPITSLCLLQNIQNSPSVSVLPTPNKSAIARMIIVKCKCAFDISLLREFLATWGHAQIPKFVSHRQVFTFRELPLTRPVWSLYSACTFAPCSLCRTTLLFYSLDLWKCALLFQKSPCSHSNWRSGTSGNLLYKIQYGISSMLIEYAIVT